MNPLTTNNFTNALEKAKAIAAKLVKEGGTKRPAEEEEGPQEGQVVKKEKLAVTQYKPKMTSTVLRIPTHMAALVLGRSGENLRNLETSCNVRIIVDDEVVDDKRTLTIEGEELSVNEAKSRIDDIVHGSGAITLLIGGNAPSGHQTIYITVPTNRVGLVIGKGGETIRNLQDRTGAKINVCKDGEIDTPPGMKTVVVNGPPHCIQVAQMLIDEIVSGHSYAGTFGLTGHAETIFVPKEKVGLVIGKGGETLKMIQNSCDVKLNIDANSDKKQERPVTISGTKEAIQKAKEQIYERVYGNVDFD
jgi:far upstream element-binding protein